MLTVIPSSSSGPLLLNRFIFLHCLHVASCTFTVEILTLGFREPVSYSSLAYSAPAMDSAVEEIQRKYGEKINFLHTYLYLENSDNSSVCRMIESNTSYALSKWYYTRSSIPDLTAFIEPGCDESMEVNRLAASWNILLITSSSSFVDQRNKTIAPTWVAAVSTSPTNYLLLASNVFKYFHWMNLFVVLDLDASRSYQVGMEGLAKYLPDLVPGCQLTIRRIRSTKVENDTEILKEFNTTSRVLFFFSHSNVLRKFMLRAHSLNMTNGEYVYLTQASFHDLDEFGNFSWHFGDRFDTAAKEAYRSLIFVENDPVIYNVPSVALVEKWKEQSWKEFGYLYKPDEGLQPAVTSTYLAVVIFGQVVSDLYESEPDFDWKDGTMLAAQFQDSKFHFNFTDVYIDIAGERSTKCMVNDLNPETGLWQVAMYQDESSRTLRSVKPMDWGGKRSSVDVPPNEPVCGYRGDHGSCATRTDTLSLSQFYGLILGVPVSGLLLILIASACIIRQVRRAAELRSTWWLLDRPQLYFRQPQQSAISTILITPNSTRKVLDNTDIMVNNTPAKGHARYQEMDVWADRIPVPMEAAKVFDDGETLRQRDKQHLIKYPKEIIKILRVMKEAPQEHINKFIGMCGYREHQSLYFVSNFCSKGSLHDLFEQPFFEDQLRISFILDLIEGLHWIHSSPLAFHGTLTGWNCLIDRHFSLKIAKFGYYHLLTHQHYGKLSPAVQESDIWRKFWTAPEVLRGAAPLSSLTDIYSLGIILNEILWNSLPYVEYNRLTSSEIIFAIENGGQQQYLMRPMLSHDGNLAGRLNPVIEQCWSEDPKNRRDINSIRHDTLRALDMKGRQRNLLDEIWDRLQAYAETLENEVAARTQAIVAERRKCDNLLQEMLPKYVVEQLRTGYSVLPETFDSTTILFTSIFGFDGFAGKATPSAITDLLNTIYSLFDRTLHRFDVYKVETILETYMVSSGVPERNDVFHTKEICSFVVSLHNKFTDTAAAKSTELQLRSGANSGPCVAAVVGNQKPRYCLFGDTVNTASRMQSTGEPSRIQISTASADILREYFPNLFDIYPRGFVKVKGKGNVLTYWVEGSRERLTTI
ncbi:atrial natriuretic peptide receptor 1-like [Paramacrobiotus metropolitanus]|uniref:atrial natriuretic peptide receptor 1-like n=1 Tax=Paramacrobiotus metropolitanus TaxID=2943436 RepID=UPI00244657A1|nr:atrial natriuretic peptide receptor 1-like [Paramacrobiotus metropolitanus]